MKYGEVLDKLRSGWYLEKYRGLYGLPPHWQLNNPKPSVDWTHPNYRKQKYGVVYNRTAQKLIQLANVSLVRTFPAETYIWIEDKDEGFF
jgi:hypothetical protein